MNFNQGLVEIEGSGNIFLQQEKDFISYKIKKDKKKLTFQNTLKINDNSLFIDFLNYKKNEKDETIIKIDGHLNSEEETIIDLISLNEGNNKIELKNLNLNKNYKINSLESVNLDYIDKDNQKNLIKIFKKKKDYFLEGEYFNAQNVLRGRFELFK